MWLLIHAGIKSQSRLVKGAQASMAGAIILISATDFHLRLPDL